MSRLSVITVFDQYIDGDTPVYSLPELNEALGRADIIRLQVQVSSSSGGSPAYTLELQDSNDNQNWPTTGTVLESNQGISSPPVTRMGDTGRAIRPRNMPP